MFADAGRQFLTIEDLVEAGFASRTTIWRQMKGGGLPHVRVGRSVRIPRAEFELWLLQQRGDEAARRYLGAADHG